MNEIPQAHLAQRVVGGAVLLALACCTGASLPSGQFSCQDTLDCASGYTCFENVCTLLGEGNTTSVGTTAGTTISGTGTTAGTSSTSAGTTSGHPTTGAAASGTAATGIGTASTGTSSSGTSAATGASSSGGQPCVPSQTAPGDGVGGAAQFVSPAGLVYSNGTLFVADLGEGTIRKIDITTATVTTLAGFPGQTGSTDAVGTCARFSGPWALTYDGDDRIFIADTNNQLLRQLSLNTGAVTTLAGTVGAKGSGNGPGTAATFFNPEGLVYLATGEPDAGQLIVADTSNGLLRQVDIPSKAVTTLPGLSFSNPVGIDLDGLGNLFIGAFSNDTVYEVALSTDISTPIGTSTNYVGGVALDGQGHIFVADRRNGAILLMSLATGASIVVAGNRGAPGFVDGAGTAAQFDEPNDLVYDGVGTLYVGDLNDNAVRQVIVDGGIVTTLAGNLPP